MPRAPKAASKKPAQTAAAVPAGGSAAEVRKAPAPLPPPEELRQMIQTAAYFKAEKDGFRMEPGFYWHEAEVEITARFRGK